MQRPWHALQAQAFFLRHIQREPGGSSLPHLQRRSFLRNGLSTEAVCAVLKGGPKDVKSLDVCLAALKASAVYLAQSDAHQLEHTLSLMYPMLDPLPFFPDAGFLGFICALTPLASAHPRLFAPHLRALLGFLPGLILLSADPGPTPAVAKSNGKGGIGDDEDDNAATDADAEKEEVRKSAMEFMLSLSEAKAAMVIKLDGWAGAVVRTCLEGMAKIVDDELDVWLEADPAVDPTADTFPHAYESSLDRLTCALGGRAVLPPAFQYIPSMLASYDRWLRDAMGKGMSKVMVHELGKLVELVLPMFGDAHPRERYGVNLFSVLIPTLEAPELRAHAHATAVLINFCEDVERDTLLPYLDLIVERLLKLLNSCRRWGRAAEKMHSPVDLGDTLLNHYIIEDLPGAWPQVRALPSSHHIISITEPRAHAASLRFYFHDGVREAYTMLIPMLLSCGKTSNTPTPQMVSAKFDQLINCIGSEQDSSFLASRFKCFADSLRVIGGPAELTPESATGIIEATKRQLQMLADKHKNRTQRLASEIADTKEDMALL
ncbi:hypothetical protein FIBSPDRAFT_954981 [Athelia psychrophila]|uniref:ARM repeat-containing protein n=1 Tax=Athelia psychrophila TaxID=1759441 RepID=A0A166IKE6_9AGAM|nr:hypothetical protein FIBSPDRAFT_954981 [Fibularhizoctonia sp. CBS 109695]